MNPSTPGPQRRLLPAACAAGAARWHFQHGPIDLLAVAEGEAAVVTAAHEAAWQRLDGLLARLVAELPQLRTPIAASGDNPLQGPVARRMWDACAPLARPHGPQGPGVFLTPMAAVAGAVAEELALAYARPGIRRAWVSNGGDIAVYLAPGQRLTAAVVADAGRAALAAAMAAWPYGAAEAATDNLLVPLAPGRLHPSHAQAQLVLRSEDPVRGIATSGFGGRSFTRGVADAVTVLARTAAEADAAATVLANAVDVPHAGIVRWPASRLRDDSDLGDLPVTVQVPRFSVAERQAALDAGLAVARQLQARGRLHAALLCCQGSLATLGPRAELQSQPV